MSRLLERSGEPLRPGRYLEPGFRPPISFAIERPGVWVARQFVDGFFDIQKEPDTLDVIAVQFCRPSAVHRSADEAAPAGYASEAIAALQSNADLTVSAPLTGAIAGIPTTTIDIETTTPPDSDAPIFSPVLRIEAGPISLASARRLRISWLDLPDGLVAILVGGSTADWTRATTAADEILATVRLESDDGSVSPGA